MKRFRVNLEDVEEEFEAESLDDAIDKVLQNIDVHEEADYCGNCEEFIDQVDLGNGSFGCPKCKRDDCISIEVVE